MSIEGLGSLDPIQAYSKQGKTSQTEGTAAKDSINLSKEAQHKAEMSKISDLLQSAPDIREDRVAEIQAKLEDPTYINDIVLDAVAEQLVDALL